jgi:hypothetical protein
LRRPQTRSGYSRISSTRSVCSSNKEN